MHEKYPSWINANNKKTWLKIYQYIKRKIVRNAKGYIVKTQAENKMDTKKNIEVRADKHESYWETDRNLDNTKKMNEINPKMLLSKEELGILEIPDYYKGDNNYTAREVCDNFDLSYHIATATTYLIRAGKKTEEGITIYDKKIEDLKKAIHHIQFEIQKTINNKNK